MPHTISIDAQRKLVLMSWTGDIGEREAIAAVSSYPDYPGFDPTFPTLVDLRKATFKQPLVTTQELAKKQQAMYPNRGPVALVVGDDLSFGAVSQFAAFSEIRGRSVKVFRDMNAAEAWLGQRPPVGKSSTGELAC